MSGVGAARALVEPNQVGPVPVLSVVIPVYEAEATLGEQLEALANEDYPESWELLVVDDASTDRSVAIAESYRDRLPVRIVRRETNGGAARARNVGVAQARAELVAFLDADDVIAPGWLKAAVCALRRYPAAASRFDVDALNPPGVRAARTGPQQTGLQRYDYPPFLPHCGACGLMVRRHVHESIGGFDPTLASLEDTDYVWRLQLAGYELHFAQDAVVRIRYRGSSWGSARQAYQYGYHNVVLYARYRERGMPRLSRRTGLARTLRLLAPGDLAKLGAVEGRQRWLRRAGWQLGRLVASCRHRVWAL